MISTSYNKSKRKRGVNNKVKVPEFVTDFAKIDTDVQQLVDDAQKAKGVTVVSSDQIVNFEHLDQYFTCSICTYIV